MTDSLESLLRANFPTAQTITADEIKPDATAEFLKKAKESISGSMVFTERSTLWWDGKE